MEIERYTLKIEGFPVRVKILGTKKRANLYNIALFRVTKPTEALVEQVKARIITELELTPQEFLNPHLIGSLREKFKKKAEAVLKEIIPSLPLQTKKVLIIKILQEMLGLGELDFLQYDENLEEYVVNSAKEPVRVYHKKYGWLVTNITLPEENKIANYSDIIARRVGRQISTLEPLLDAHLTSGDRANAVLYPISNKGNTITVRKFSRDPWTVTDLIKNKTCSAEVFALIWTAIQYEMNVLISGGTASGKTSMLNVCMPFIPSNHRIISMEDTRELQLPSFLYWAPLTTRLPNPEGKGEVTMLNLLVNSLRMRPDRIILGEIRRKQEAEVLFEAMHTGHSVYATVHADSVDETITRLINPPISVPPNLLGAVNLNVVMFRDRRRGIRRLYQVGEFIKGSEREGMVSLRPNILYRWKPTEDQIVAHQRSYRFLEELSSHTGLTAKEFNSAMKDKIKILNWMVKHEVRQVDAVGAVINYYYEHPEKLLAAVNKNQKPSVLDLQLKKNNKAESDMINVGKSEDKETGKKKTGKTKKTKKTQKTKKKSRKKTSHSRKKKKRKSKKTKKRRSTKKRRRR